ncbi:MAG: cytochrome c3 family protein [Bryobacterales bacterium]|jgi:hypothetical protein|nr:cytochrome c3 family protein [Bryobacterales bacterium]
MGWLFLLALAASAAGLPDLSTPRAAPEQPLPFSHKQHSEVGLKCAQCHPIPEPGDFATLPKTEICMACHKAVKKDSPHILKLAAWHEQGERIRWAPVYRIPDWVSFSHQRHTAVKDVTCGSCHGPVATRDVLQREKNLSMAACMSCHRATGASNDCVLCHDQR